MKISLQTGQFLVLSDLHIGHQASQLQSVAPLEKLIQPGRTLIFNGDTFEMRRPGDRDRAALEREKLQILLERAGVEAHFIGGNHDPYISEINHLECLETGILITHGDILFQNVAPWSMNERLYRKAHASELAKLIEAEQKDFVSRLAALRRATKSYDISHAEAAPGWMGSVVHFCETVWPPWRPLRILRSWAEIPSRAEALVVRYRPEMRTILIGHSHFSGVWKRKNLRVINTGAAMCGFRPRAVCIDAGRITVRQMALRDGHLEMGRTVFQEPADPSQRAAASAVASSGVPDLH